MPSFRKITVNQMVEIHLKIALFFSKLTLAMQLTSLLVTHEQYVINTLAKEK